MLAGLRARGGGCALAIGVTPALSRLRRRLRSGLEHAQRVLGRVRSGRVHRLAFLDPSSGVQRYTIQSDPRPRADHVPRTCSPIRLHRCCCLGCRGAHVEGSPLHHLQCGAAACCKHTCAPHMCAFELRNRHWALGRRSLQSRNGRQAKPHFWSSHSGRQHCDLCRTTRLDATAPGGVQGARCCSGWSSVGRCSPPPGAKGRAQVGLRSRRNGALCLGRSRGGGGIVSRVGRQQLRTYLVLDSAQSNAFSPHWAHHRRPRQHRHRHSHSAHCWTSRPPRARFRGRRLAGAGPVGVAAAGFAWGPSRAPGPGGVDGRGRRW